MIQTCSHCDRGEHDLCCGLIDGTGGIEFDCECPCQAKYNKADPICPDCGDLMSRYRPDCHSLTGAEFAEFLAKELREKGDPNPDDINDEDDELTGKKETTVQDVSSVTGSAPAFPFRLEDLAYWVVKRKDGTTIKYTLVGPDDKMGGKEVKAGVYPSSVAPLGQMTGGTTHSFSDWCKHDPIGEPIWDGGKVKIWIADSMGLKGYYQKFDVVLDCGDVLNLFSINKDGKLIGDEELIKVLKPFVIGGPKNQQIIKIDWDDRKAPPLDVDAWMALAKHLSKKSQTVVTACQGGHGRSGTSLVCLMMALNPEYTPYSSICHLRAMHCPRAIESKEQHMYINAVGKELGREEDIMKVGEVKSFKESFLALDLKSAKPYQDRLIIKMDKEAKK